MLQANHTVLSERPFFYTFCMCSSKVANSSNSDAEEATRDTQKVSLKILQNSELKTQNCQRLFFNKVARIF